MTFHLETLGGLRLVAVDGQGVQAQRRRLALLALLAAAGERGLTRDRLVADLWPETSEERARHALNQLLYGIRQSLSENALRGVDPLVLDPDVVDSDVRRFELALSAGALREAVAQYHGPFLDAFYLPDAPEFERRVEEVRVRLAAAHADALERLATDAESRGDAAEVVAWRRTLAELDRLDARRAIALMRALVAAGDSAGALSHGRTYETLVREELDVPADPAVVALASEIRAAVASRAPSSSRTTTSPEPAILERSSSVDLNEVDLDASAVATPAAASRRSKRIIAYGVAALALVAVSLGVQQATSDRSAGVTPTTASARSIAVLPLKDLGTEPGDPALADGMTEALIAMLSRLGDLRVIPSTSVFALRDQRMDVRQIAETLHVSHLLEGGVQKVGTRLRMQIRLIDARDGSTRWSETYDREMGDIFAVQDDISRSVTRELGVRLAAGSSRGVAARRYTPSIEAYELYLRGMDATLQRGTGGLEQGIDYLNRAIAADSNFAAAYAGLVRMHMTQAGSAPGDVSDTQARALWAAQRAVALDDSLPGSFVALGWARIALKDWVEAEAALKHAIALDPRAPGAHEGLARMYMWTGRRAEQLAAARREVEIDPFSYSAVRELALALAVNGQCDEALERLLPLKSLTPPARVAGVIRGQCYAAKQMWPEAIDEYRWSMGGGARTALAFLGHALARGGHVAEADSILSDLIAGRKNSHGAFGIAAVYAGRRDYDRAFAWLDKAADEGTVRVYLMGPMFEDLHRDPRFAGVKRRMGL